MKALFIPTKSRARINPSEISKLKLPKNIALFYSIQYETQAKEIKQILGKKHNIIAFAQVLGCSKPKIPKSTQAILLIGDGRFHALSLAIETSPPIYIYDLHKLTQIPQKEITEFKNKSKGSYINYLKSGKIGILVSTKPGQQNLQHAIQFKNKTKNKHSYILIANNINPAEFENFPDIKAWVNTACPRLNFDSTKIVNLSGI